MLIFAESIPTGRGRAPRLQWVHRWTMRAGAAFLTAHSRNFMAMSETKKKDLKGRRAAPLSLRVTGREASQDIAGGMNAILADVWPSI